MPRSRKNVTFVPHTKRHRASPKSDAEWEEYKPQIMEICHPGCHLTKKLQSVQGLGLDVR
jgi:hypothetical protein